MSHCVSQKVQVMLCNRASLHTFGKLNFEGVFLGDIFVSRLPYTLEAQIVVIVDRNAVHAEKIRIQLFGEGFRDERAEVELPTEGTVTVLAYPLYWTINNLGQYHIEVLSETELLVQRTFHVRLGLSPAVRATGQPDLQLIITSPQSGREYIKNLLKRTIKNLVIIDSYPDAEEWHDILQGVSNSAQIRVIIGKRRAKRPMDNLRDNLPSLDYRLAERTPYKSLFHDRFLIIDDSEYYHLGQSLKDLGCSIGRLSQITDQQDVDDLRDAIVGVWPNIFT